MTKILTTKKLNQEKFLIQLFIVPDLFKQIFRVNLLNSQLPLYPSYGFPQPAYAPVLGSPR